MASIPEQLVAQVASDSGLAGVTIAIGERELQTHAAPPRVVAVFRGSDISTPDRVGDAMFTDKGRIILVRNFRIDWYCHGVPDSEGLTDFTNAEILFQNTIIAIREAFHNSVLFSDEEWLDQQENADSFERQGTVIKFTSTIAIPIYEKRGGIVTLTATPKIDTTLTIEGSVPGDAIEIQEG